MKLRVLHLEDNEDDVELVRNTLARDGLDCEIFAVETRDDYQAALQHTHFDAVLCDSSVLGYGGRDALSDARERFPGIPFIVVSAGGGNQQPTAADASRQSPPAGAVTAQVAKSEIHRLGPTLRRVLADPVPPPDSTAADSAAERVACLERKLAERTVEVERRNTEIEVLNKELEAFSYSVAHDLRSPLITIDGFAQVLVENTADKLDQPNKQHLERISAAVRRMHRLINDLLELSKIVRAPMRAGTVDLSALARQLQQQLRDSAPERAAEFVIADGLTTRGDPGLLRTALENLLSNAWKFTSRKELAHIEFGSDTDRTGRVIYYVRDNGAGFDPRYAGKLFSPFQRLHAVTQYPGTGIGLAVVQRIVHRHSGEIWAESAVDCGATFYFTLPR